MSSVHIEPDLHDRSAWTAEVASKRRDDRVASLAAVVTRRRKELGLLQSELAALAGCSERFVHTVEHGKQTLRLDKLLDVLEV
ncbi:MAG TPA: hypothetical protein VMM35_02585, partial [Longimicrobiales bacterium]|nr:hypothetical protein [Longimicrobiales bacterium]